VKDVSFEVKEGEIVAILGPNGAGKSSLFSMISMLISRSNGDIRLLE